MHATFYGVKVLVDLTYSCLGYDKGQLVGYCMYGSLYVCMLG